MLDAPYAQIRTRHPLETAPQPALRELERIRSQRKRIGVACSGGADSVFLLRWLLAHFPDLRDCLVALHYNHRARGRESDGDEAFARELAERTGVAFRSKAAHACDSRASEGQLRALRIAFFRDASREEDLAAIATA